MATQTLEEIQQDELAMSVARSLAIANEAAAADGIELAESMITIMEESPPPARVWRIHYGPRDYIHRRGGDLTVFTEDRAGTILRVLRGQ